MVGPWRGIVTGMAFCLLMQPVSLLAQSSARGSGWGARMVMEPVILAHGGISALCNSRAAKLATWGVEQIEKAVKPTEAQRVTLNELKTATVKAADLSVGVCPTPIPRGSSERLVFLGKRLAALQQATQIIIPAFEAFHASLREDQRVQLDAGPSRWRWRRS